MISYKVQRESSGEMTVFSINGAGTHGYPYAKTKKTLFFPYTKITQKGS